MSKRILILLIALLLAGCININVPDGVAEHTVDSDAPLPAQWHCYAADEGYLVSARGRSAKAGLNPDGFRLLNWNAYKGQQDNWLKTFSDYSKELDLVTLQEAWLSDPLRSMLADAKMQWDLALTFRLKQRESGVMTLSRITPQSVCVQRTLEPWLLLPKSTLISTFELTGRQESLLVANVHAVNFAFGTVAFRSQLAQLADQIEQHDGPIILAGDFNTWSTARLKILESIVAAPLGLTRVPFDPGQLKMVFDHTLDHVFYRQLQVVSHQAQNSNASDHNPMWVTFRHVDDRF